MPATYAINQVVLLRPGIHVVTSPDLRYAVVRVLPGVGHAASPLPQYLVVNLSDGHQRVVSEQQIERLTEGDDLEPAPRLSLSPRSGQVRAVNAEARAAAHERMKDAARKPPAAGR